MERYTIDPDDEHSHRLGDSTSAIQHNAVFVRLLRADRVTSEEFNKAVLLTMISTRPADWGWVMGSLPLDVERGLREYSAKFLKDDDIRDFSSPFVWPRGDQAREAKMASIFHEILTKFVFIFPADSSHAAQA